MLGSWERKEICGNSTLTRHFLFSDKWMWGEMTYSTWTLADLSSTRLHVFSAVTSDSSLSWQLALNLSRGPSPFPLSTLFLQLLLFHRMLNMVARLNGCWIPVTKLLAVESVHQIITFPLKCHAISVYDPHSTANPRSSSKRFFLHPPSFPYTAALYQVRLNWTAG